MTNVGQILAKMGEFASRHLQTSNVNAKVGLYIPSTIKSMLMLWHTKRVLFALANFNPKKANFRALIYNFLSLM